MALPRLVVALFAVVIAAAAGISFEVTHRRQERIALNERKLADARAALAALPSDEELVAERARIMGDLAAVGRLDTARRQALYGWLTTRSMAAHVGADLLAWSSVGDRFEAAAIAEQSSEIAEMLRLLRLAGVQDLMVQCFSGHHCAAGDEALDRLGMGSVTFTGILPGGDDVPATIDPMLLPLQGPMRLVPVTLVRAEELQRRGL